MHLLGFESNIASIISFVSIIASIRANMNFSPGKHLRIRVAFLLIPLIQVLLLSNIRQGPLYRGGEADLDGVHHVVVDVGQKVDQHALRKERTDGRWHFLGLALLLVVLDHVLAQNMRRDIH